MELKGEQISLVLLAAVALDEFAEIFSLVWPRNAFCRRAARERRRSFAPKNSRPRHNPTSIRLHWDCQRLLPVSLALTEKTPRWRGRPTLQFWV